MNVVSLGSGVGYSFAGQMKNIEVNESWEFVLVGWR